MRLGWVILHTRDVPGMRAFYEALGLRVQADYGMWVEFKTAPAKLALHAAEDEESRGVGIFLEVADVDAHFRRLRERGIAEAPPEDREFGYRTFCVRDPQGNRIEFGEPLAL